MLNMEFIWKAFIAVFCSVSFDLLSDFCITKCEYNWFCWSCVVSIWIYSFHSLTKWPFLPIRSIKCLQIRINISNLSGFFLLSGFFACWRFATNQKKNIAIIIKRYSHTYTQREKKQGDEEKREKDTAQKRINKNIFLLNECFWIYVTWTASTYTYMFAAVEAAAAANSRCRLSKTRTK